MCSQVIAGRSDGTLPLEVLERQITALACAIHAATCRWLLLVAEYDARAGWAQWGCGSCAQWVSWRCAIAPGAAREHVRVARRLGGLPVIAAAFGAGELSYSKVRALTRVQDVVCEHELLELARHATASQLERLLRAYRGVVATERAAAGGRAQRWLVIEHDDRGAVLVRGRFPAEQGALIIAALEAAQDELAQRAVPTASPAHESGSGGPAGAPAGTDQQTASDVPAGTRTETDEPVSDGPAGTRAATDKTWSDVPAGTRSGADEPSAGELGSGVPAGTPRVSASEARADALLVLADDYLAGARGARTGGERYQVLVHVDTATLAGSDQIGRCELDDGTPLAAATARRLACDAAIVRMLERDGTPLSIGRKTRTIPPALRRALRTRDRGCRFPACTARRFIDAHHIQPWAHGGPPTSTTSSNSAPPTTASYTKAPFASNTGPAAS